MGLYGKIFNDFGLDFKVLDKNGELPLEAMIKNITNDEQGVVTVIDGMKH